jgi:hypothetical protein
MRGRRAVVKGGMHLVERDEGGGGLEWKDGSRECAIVMGEVSKIWPK